MEIKLYPGEDGFIIAECISLPGCISQGATYLDALANLQEAIEIYQEVVSER
jgi:predicted RNase H-like HicB family nuclease